MSSLLFKVSPVDPVTYATITATVFATAYFACYLPSRRAAAVDPWTHCGRSKDASRAG
jgi:ABC-type lipoprotein release transport system permease subunit